jgi:drug/metabolite transporter (DMT)-like permease
MILVSLFWGANFGISKYGLRYIDPLSFSAARFLVASMLLYGLARRYEPTTRPSGRIVWQLAGLGIVGNTIYQMAFMTGLSRTTATNGSLIMAAMPVMVAVIGTLLGVEVPTRAVRWGIAIGTAGVLLVVGAKGAKFSGATWSGDLLVLFAVICWSLFTVGVRRMSVGLSPLWVTTITTMGGTPGLLLGALPHVGRVPWSTLVWGAWAALAFSTIFALVISYVLWSRSVQSIGASRVALYSCVIPIFAIVVAWLLLDERPLWIQGVGALLVISGVVVSQSQAFRPVPEAV